jgi:hypothetical protein
MKKENSTKVEINNQNVMAILSYLGILWLIPFFIGKKDDFLDFHLKTRCCFACYGNWTDFDWVNVLETGWNSKCWTVGDACTFYNWNSKCFTK